MYLHLYVHAQNLRVDPPPPFHLLEISNFYNTPHPFTGIMLDSVGLMVIYMIGCKQGMYSSTYN